MTAQSIRRGERGVVFLAVLVMLFVGVVLLMAAVEPASVVMQREREAELVFRGQEITEAIRQYRAEHGGAYPTHLKDLLKEGPRHHRYIRHLYRNPFAPDGKWKILNPGATVVKTNDEGTITVESGAGGVGGKNPLQGGRIGSPGGRPPPGTKVLPFKLDGEEGAPIVGVYCGLHKEGFREFRGAKYIDQWYFSPLVIPAPRVLRPGEHPAPPGNGQAKGSGTAGAPTKGQP